MKTPEEIEKMAIEWSNDYIGEVSKRISKTAFIEAYTRCQQDKSKKIEEQNTNIEDRVIVLSQQYALEKCKDNMSALTKVKVAVEYGFKVCYEQFQKESFDKKYTLDDMKKACAVGIDIVNKEGENNFQPFEDLIISLSKKY